MDFGAALADLKAGHRVARKHWGRERYIAYRARGRDGYEPHLMLHAGPGLEEPWFPTHADLLAANWGRCPNGEATAGRARPAGPTPAFTLKADGPRMTAQLDLLCTAKMLWQHLGITRDQVQDPFDVADTAAVGEAALDELVRTVSRAFASIDKLRAARGDRDAP